MLLAFINHHNSGLYLTSDFGCIAFSYAYRVVLELSSWLNAFISIDRLLWAFYINKLSFTKVKRFLYSATAGFILLLLVVNVPNLFLRLSSTERVEFFTANDGSCENRTRLSRAECSASPGWIYSRDLVYWLSRNVFPYLISIVISSFLLFKLIKAKKKFCYAKAQRAEYHFAKSAVCLNAFFVVCLLPNGAIESYMHLFGIREVGESNTMLDFALLISKYVALYYNAFSFFVNYMFNDLFRIELIRLIGGGVSFVCLRDRDELVEKQRSRSGHN